MRLDSLIRLFLPREERFHEHFAKNTANLVLAGKAFFAVATADNAADRQLRLVELRALEHEGDAITRQIFEALNSSFITPLDREDIRALAVDLDDVLDYLEGVAQFIVLFETGKTTPELTRFAAILLEMVQQLQQITELVWDLKSTKKIHEGMVRISELENEADSLHLSALGELFRKDAGRDPIDVLKWKEIYQSLEDACDKCKEFTHVVGNIVTKNA